MCLDKVVPVHSTASSLSKRNRPSPNTEKRKPMLNWTVLVMALLVGSFHGLAVDPHFLQGPTLRDYDQVPPNGRVGSRERASPPIRKPCGGWNRPRPRFTPPQKQRRATIRRVMARGFVEPSLLAGDTDHQLGKSMPAACRANGWQRRDSDPHAVCCICTAAAISGPRAAIAITTKLAQVTGVFDSRALITDRRRSIHADINADARPVIAGSDHGTHRLAPRPRIVRGRGLPAVLALMCGTAWARDAGLRPAHGGSRYRRGGSDAVQPQ